VASYGIAGFAPETPERNTSLEALVLIASRCLAQAKSAGGNQVLCCP
jgi:GGDEF domain-containing protein